jgi:multicomponent Na+:H+ antiporter subunit D
VLGAIAQNEIKRILSFHIVSQIGYMIFGIAIGGVAGVAATIFFLVYQIPVKTSLFLVDGMVEQATGTSRLDRLSGLARRSGFLAILFLLPALSLAGIPPLAGFVAKFGLVTAGFDAGEGLVVAIALACSLLTLVSMSKIWVSAFWGEPHDTSATDGIGGVAVIERTATRLRWPALVVTGTVGLVAVGVAIALFAGPLYALCERAAADMVPALHATATRGS